MAKRPRAARRSALIEALVGSLVFAAGLLGIAALYTQGRIAGRATAVRARAAELAADLAERARANRAAGDAYADARASAVAPGGHCDVTSRCSPADIAREDKAEWLESVRRELPGGAASVIALVPGGYTVTVMWREPVLGPGKYVLSFSP